jgi:hypothetical protein
VGEATVTEPDEGGPDVEAALQQWHTLDVDGTQPELFLITGTSSEVSEILATRPTEGLVAVLRGIVAGYVESWGQLEPIAYADASNPADEQVMWASSETVPLLASAGTDFQAADLELFDPKKRGIAQLRLSVIRVQVDSSYALLYRRLNAKQIVARSTKIPVIQRQDRLDLIEGDTLLIDRGVDAVVIGGAAFFRDRAGFQRLFGFLQELREQAAETFDDVTADLRIANLDEMRAAATGQAVMLAKMASIGRKLRDYPAYRESITMERLAAFVAENPHTGVQIEGEGADAHFVFENDVSHRFKILKLLDDDYLQSQLTELNYDANSKGMPLA